MRALLRLVVVVVILLAVAAFFFGYRWGGGATLERTDQPVATTGAGDRTVESRAREAGAEIGNRVAAGAREAERALAEGRLTAKVKSKIALDDTLDGSDIGVETTGTVITLSGRVTSEAQRQRALQLARETDGVTSVTDALAIR